MNELPKVNKLQVLPKINKLKVLHLNVNSIYNKTDEISVI